MTRGMGSFVRVSERTLYLALGVLMAIDGSQGLAVAADANKSVDFDKTWKEAVDGGPLSWHGFTLYGAIDVSGQYASRSVRTAPDTYTGAGQILPNSQGPRWYLAPNQESTSFVGLKFDHQVAFATSVIGALETGFNPLTGELANNTAQVKRNNGLPLLQQLGAGETTRAGQVFNGNAYVGLRNEQYGTLTVGRQLNINADALFGYNPMSGSFGFDLFSFYGAPGSFAAPATLLIDSSVKYANKIGPFTIKALYANPGASVKQSFQGLIGFEQGGFGGNVYGGHQSDEVAVFSLSSLLPGALNSPYVGARVADATAYGANVGYTFNLGGSAIAAAPGILKAPAAVVFSPTLTLSGGYQNLRLSNPADGGYGVGHVVNGGYIIGPVISANGSPVFGVANTAFNGGDKIVDTFFVGAKYRWAANWTFSLFYGQERNNAFGFGNAAANPAVSAKYCSSSSFSNCAGYIDGAAFRFDYQWSRRANLYFGTTYSAVHGGAAFGYIHKDAWSPTLGMRYQF